MWKLVVNDAMYLDIVFMIRDRVQFLQDFINNLTPEDNIDPTSYLEEVHRLFEILRLFEDLGSQEK